MKPISNEKRELIIEAKKRGETEKEIAKWLKISEGTVTAIWHLYRESGNYSPKLYPCRKSVLATEKLENVKVFVKNNPDKTLNEIIEELELPIQKSRLSVLLTREGYSFKKKRLILQDKTVRTSKRSEKNSSKL